MLRGVADVAVFVNAFLGDIGVEFTTQYVQLTLSGAILFDSASSELKESVLPILSNVGVILEKYANHTIEIEGHTDNVPMSSGRFDNNYELSIKQHSEYRKKNRDRIREREKKYYHKNKDSIMKKWNEFYNISENVANKKARQKSKQLIKKM